MIILQSFNWIDYIIFILIFFYLWEGLVKGFIYGLFDLVGFLLSFCLALSSYHFFSQLLIERLHISRGIAKAFGFFMVVIIAEMVLSILISYLYRLFPRKLLRSSFNRIFGMIPAFLNSLIVISLVLTLLVGIPIRPGLKSEIISSRIGGILVRKTQGLDILLNSVFNDAVAETISFLTIRPQSDEVIALHYKLENVSVDEQAQKKMFNLINRERMLRALSPLSFNSDLTWVAQQHATDMFKRGYFSHYTPEGLTPFNRLKNAETSFFTAGENLAYAPDVELAHQGLMESKGHRENILSEQFHKVGIGVIDGGIYGKIFVQEFSD